MPGGLIIIGASHAGVQLAAKSRELGYQEPITLINAEPGFPYQKPPLSKAFLLGKIDEVDLALRSERFFADAGISLLSAKRCVGIDRTTKTVALSDGARLGYDTLALATGARARTLPTSFGKIPSGVLSLRTIEDARFVRTAVASARKVVVVGGGFIGLEVASALSTIGCQVALVEFQPRLLARSCSPEVADAIACLHRSAGVELHLQAGLAEIHARRERLERVTLTNGLELDADMLLFGIGAVPNVESAADAGLPCDNGVLIDQFCRTADPHILAVGDCTSFPSHQLGIPIRLECIQNAHDQAVTAAATLMGRSSPYASAPWFWSDQHDCKFQMVGFLDRVDQTIRRGSEDGSFSLWHFAEKRLHAVETINRPGEHVLARQLISRNRLPTPEQVADSAFNLRTVLAPA